MKADVMAARRDWDQGYARLLAEACDPRRSEQLHAQVEVVTAELRRRVGGTYTLHELAEVYLDSDSWARRAVADHAPFPGWPRTLTVVGDAAFYLYARGAVDYTP